MIEIIILHALKNIKNTFLAVFLMKLLFDDKFSKLAVLYRGKNATNTFIGATIEEFEYCKKIIKKHFNKNLVISAEFEERFQLSNKCWVCDKLFDAGDNKVRKV